MERFSPHTVLPQPAAGSPRTEAADGLLLIGDQLVKKKHYANKKKCEHGCIEAQCRTCKGYNICSEHDQRSARCHACFINGKRPSELCPIHGKRIGACGPCIKAGV